MRYSSETHEDFCSDEAKHTGTMHHSATALLSGPTPALLLIHVHLFSMSYTGNSTNIVCEGLSVV